MAYGLRPRWSSRGLGVVCVLVLAVGGAFATGSAAMASSPNARQPVAHPASSAQKATDPPAPGPYAYRTLDNQNDVAFNQLLGVNDAGKIAGYFGSGAKGHPNKGYTVVPPYGQGNYTDENFPGSAQTQVTGLNNGNVTVGFLSDTNNGIGLDDNIAWANVGGTFRTANFPGQPNPANPPVDQLLGVNNHNIAVGFYNDSNGSSHGYTYNIGANTFQSITPPTGVANLTTTGINDEGDISGFLTTAGGAVDAFLLKGGNFTVTAFPGATSTMALGVNDFDEVVGTYTDAAGLVHGFTWRAPNGAFAAVDDPHGIGTTTVNGLDNNGDIVGFYLDAAGNTHGFLGQLSHPVAMSRQFGAPNQTDEFTVTDNGTVDVRWVQNGGKWNGPLAISPPGTAPPGAYLAASNQFGTPDQTDVFVVGDNGATQVLWVQGIGNWHGPLQIGSPNGTPPGGDLAAGNQGGIPDQTDVFGVGDNGATTVLWVQGAGHWNGPLTISGSNLSPPGAGVATSPQFGGANQTDVWSLDNTGTSRVLWVQNAGKWNGPLAIGGGGQAGGGVAASNQFGIPNQTDLFAVNASTGIVTVAWVQGGGPWNGPGFISPSIATPGASLAASNQFGIPNQTDVFLVGENGATAVLWVQGGGPWNGPLTISGTTLSPPGEALAAGNQFGLPTQTDVFARANDGRSFALWVQRAGHWSGPLFI